VKVEVRLFATLATFLPTQSRGHVALELDDRATLADLVSALGIPDDLSHVALVNGEDAAHDRRLRDGDVVDLFPPLAGG
jgi:molybdopterin converting factor small subunit